MNKISDDILCKVEKPSRYVGGELNQVIKDPKDVDIRFAFCFPDVYEVGMSHLGTRILYHTINLREDTYCERVFSFFLAWIYPEYRHFFAFGRYIFYMG